MRRKETKAQTIEENARLILSQVESYDQIAQARDQEEFYETESKKSNISTRQEEWKSRRNISRTENLSKSRKQEPKTIACAFSRKDWIWRNCDAKCKRFKMPQGKRRFDEVKTKFKEWKFWKFQVEERQK